jgi:hypothetical protein
MAGDNDLEKKGFSGLSGLTSNIRGFDEPTKPEPEAEAKSSAPKQQPQPQPATTPEPHWSAYIVHQAAPQPQPAATTPEPERKTTRSRPSIEVDNSGKSDGRSIGKWAFGILSVIFVIWMINSNNKPSYNLPPSSQSSRAPQSSPVPGTQPPREPSNVPSSISPSESPRAELQYTKPSVGTNNILSVSAIRWCTREKIRLDAMQARLSPDSTRASINYFNTIVDDYNARCGNFRYRSGDLEKAQRDVEAERVSIASAAVREVTSFSASPTASTANAVGRSDSPNQLPSSSRPSTPSVPISPKPLNGQDIQEAQQLLTNLGYAPGPVDGQYGRRTAEAARSFQRDAGITQDGQIDQNLLSALRRVPASMIKPHASTSQQQSQQNQFDISQLSINERVALDLVCSDAKYRGPAAYNQCISKQLTAMGSSRTPDISHLSINERVALNLACTDAQHRGPAAYNQCVSRQLTRKDR